MNFEKVINDIYILKTPFSNVWTGIIFINGDKKILIDSGADEPQKYIVPALKEMGIPIVDINYILNTHSHGDHISGHYTLRKKFGIKTVVLKEGYENLENPADNAKRIRTKFPDNSPKIQSELKGIEADVTLEKNDIFENRLQVLYTPGHDMDCVCWYDLHTKTLITGDSLQGNGTKSQGVGFYQNIDDYRNSLKMLLQHDVENIICGHDYDGIGSIIKGKENVKNAIKYCLDITYEYEKIIKKCYMEGQQDIAKIAKKLIEQIGCGMPEKLFLAMYTVNEHLKEI